MSRVGGAACAGLVLAAGAGHRFGGGTEPKVLLTDGHGSTFLSRAVRTLTGAGCGPVVVVLGAHEERVRAELRRIEAADGTDIVPVVCSRWREGMGKSLRTGLNRLSDLTGDEPAPEGVVVTLADLPGQHPGLVRRLLEADVRGAGALARLTYDGKPGHPVLLGHRRWPAAAAAAHGDIGARALFDSGDAIEVDASDLSTGVDVDRPADLAGVVRHASLLEGAVG